jgi:squalene-associated FAD-dependent desaturase
MSPHTVVIGGGLAGLTAAVRLADRGDAVTLLEGGPRLGGLTRSFSRAGLLVDTGQHVFLRCCTSYLALLDRLGVRDQVTLQDALRIPVAAPRPGRGEPVRAELRRSSLPAPLHLAGALARYRLLPPVDRLRVGRAALALRRVDPADPAVDAQSFGSWLAARGQGERAVATLWDLIGVAALNAPADRASLALAATVFRTGLLSAADAADIGWSRVPLQRLHGDAGARALTSAGADVRTGVRVTGLRRSGNRWLVSTGGAHGGQDVPADRVVLAVPPAAAERLAPPGAVRLRPGWAARLGAVPIVNVHVRYDRPVLHTPFLAAVDSPVQWIFDRTAPAGCREGQYLAVSLSAAGDLLGRTAAQLQELVLPALAEVLPAARSARVLDVFVTREREATFDPAPGQAAHRPPATTTAPGLVLAGAWTDTGWPATMEGAVRSGDAAVAALDPGDGSRRDDGRPRGGLSRRPAGVAA